LPSRALCTYHCGSTAASLARMRNLGRNQWVGRGRESANQLPRTRAGSVPRGVVRPTSETLVYNGNSSCSALHSPFPPRGPPVPARGPLHEGGPSAFSLLRSHVGSKRLADTRQTITITKDLTTQRETPSPGRSYL
jgi:hypothetical protein